MTDNRPDCRHARLHIGADPRNLPADVQAHVAGCAACARLLDETRALDGRLRSALELPLDKFRTPAPASRWGQLRWGMAASLLLGVLVGGGVWLASTPPALAGELVAHVRHESASWGMRDPLAAGTVAEVLHAAGVEFDTSMPVVYASACPFHGGVVPHLVVQTAQGPLTVILLPHEKVRRRAEFAEHGLRGVLLPAGEGGIAVLARGGVEVPEPLTREIVSGARW